MGALSLSCWQSHGSSPRLSGPTQPPTSSPIISHMKMAALLLLPTFPPFKTLDIQNHWGDLLRAPITCGFLVQKSALAPHSLGPWDMSPFPVVLVSGGCCYSFSQTGWLTYQFWGLAIQDQGAGRVCFFWGSRRRICSVPLSFLPAASDNPSLVDGILPVSSHRPLSMPVCLCVQFPLHKGTSHTELRPTFMTSSCLDRLRRSCFQLRSHSQVLGVRTSTSLWWIQSTGNTRVVKPFIGWACTLCPGYAPGHPRAFTVLAAMTSDAIWVPVSVLPSLRSLTFSVPRFLHL